MASVSTENVNGRKRYRVTFRDADGKRRCIRLPCVTKKHAGEAASKVQSIVKSLITQAPLENDVADWLANLSDDLYAKIAAAGICQPRKLATLGEFIESLIAGWESAPAATRPAERTIINRKQTRDRLFAPLGKNTPLRNLTAEHGAKWQEGLEDKHASATVTKHVKIANYSSAKQQTSDF